jgi:hypothetical protein
LSRKNRSFGVRIKCADLCIFPSILSGNWRHSTPPFWSISHSNADAFLLRAMGNLTSCLRGPKTVDYHWIIDATYIPQLLSLSLRRERRT